MAFESGMKGSRVRWSLQNLAIQDNAHEDGDGATRGYSEGKDFYTYLFLS